MGIERVDNWELVIQGSDLTNGRYKIEDAHIRAALIREIGTDSPKPVTFGIRDRPYITIDKYIAPYYKAAHNLNVMRASTKTGLKWGFTGYEWPLPVDTELEFSGLETDQRIYLRGTLYKNVLSTDDPINRYLMARSVEIAYKQLRPLYWKDVLIPSEFGPGKQFVLDTSGAVPALVEWNPQDPRYTIAPSANIYFVIRNTIQVLWPDENVKPHDVEFRIKHDRIDVGAQPRLDHMFLPPSDGTTRIVEEWLYFKSIDNCDTQWTAATNVTTAVEPTIRKEGTNSAKITIAAAFSCGGSPPCKVAHHAVGGADGIDITAFRAVGFWIRADTAIAAGTFDLYLCETDDGTNPVEIINIPRLETDEWTYVVGFLKRPGVDNAIKSVALYSVVDDPGTPTLYIDDIRPLPNRLTQNPMAGTEYITEYSPADADLKIESINYATGEIVFSYDKVPEKALLTYYALRSGGGRDIFSLREINKEYHTVRYPHKQSYVFRNVGDESPTGTAYMDIYTLAEYHQEIPAAQRIPSDVFAAARPLLV